jgi:N-acetyl-1-D-myo-inositol-2-amino-2-deoxy-alpha-D-glucopyranoside deacetylase
VFGLTLGRVLLLHAHPDDETLATGGLIALLVERGVWVGVLSATRGERGEVVPGSHYPGADLVAVRMAELTEALAALGVCEHYFLGEPPARRRAAAPRRYADSGMRWEASGIAMPAADVTPDSLTAAPFDEVVADLGALIDTVRPELLISYDATGGYGHPDHLRMHWAGLAAAGAAGLPFAEVTRPDPAGGSGSRMEVVDVSAQRPKVLAALRAYPSQLEQAQRDHVIHVGGQRQDLPSAEYYRLR